MIRRIYATQMQHHAGRWPRRLITAGALLLLGGIGYTALRYVLYRTLPFMSNTAVASAILAEAQRPAAPAPQRAAGGERRQSHGLDGTLVYASSPGGPRSAPRPRAQLQHGRIEQGTIHSALLPGDHPLLIYLPPHYDDSQRRYPVLYLLHGAPGAYTDWRDAGGIQSTLDAMISVGGMPPLIVVLPDGNGGGFFSDSEWANSGDGRLRAEDYLTQELVPYIDQHYRTEVDWQHRALGGLSTGGYGAVNLLLHHPDLFGTALSISGNYLAARTWTGQDIWAGNAAARAYNSPLIQAAHVAELPQRHLYLAVGASDTTDNTAHQTAQFDALLTQLHVPHRTQTFPGQHSWIFWRTHIVDALDYLASVLPH